MGVGSRRHNSAVASTPEPDAALGAFSAPTRSWFTGAFAAPTAAQGGAWESISSGEHTLVVAPTGSGKTLAAFLWALDHLLTGPEPAEGSRRCRVLYISPLKALAADVQRNLRSPLVGVARAAEETSTPVREVTVGVRTGDTPAAERRRFGTHPPDILITTPESLFLMLTSGAREGLRGVEQVIIDEVHALAGNKRGAHLALSLERLDALLEQPAQRIGLSATVRPPESVARYLTGEARPAEGSRSTRIVQPDATRPGSRQLRIDVAVPVPDLSDIAAAAPAQGSAPPEHGAASIWSHVTERVVDEITSHSSTIVFANSRRGAERLAARINEAHAQRQGTGSELDAGSAWAAEVPAQSGTSLGITDETGPAEIIARPHHGSMSRDERTATETALKNGTLPAVVATSSLELGIDMGAVDLVIQVGAPPSVASALQRIGRAGHQVGALSHGVVLPTHRGDLLAAATTSARARTGHIEATRTPTNPLDVLAQQIVAMCAVDDWTVTDLAALVRRAAPFTTLTDRVLTAVLDMLSGRYPSESFAELRPRITWDRVAGTLTGRPGARLLASVSGGTIPDRGMYGVYVAGESSARGGKRVGELDEEMVYESRVGDTFTLGSSTWRIEDITPDRVLVSPAPGLPGRLPFWKGDAPGRPAELGAAIGAMVRSVTEATTPADAVADWGLDDWARDNLLAYLAEQQEATGRLPDDRTIVVERFRDELGDWRVVIHSPYGAKVHAPWALILSARLRERFGLDVAAMHADDGIVLRLPDTEAAASVLDDFGPMTVDDLTAPTDTEAGEVPIEDLLLESERIDTDVMAALSSSPHFAARFREAAARSLMLPRRRPDQRQPLWQQRQRAAQLLAVAAEYPEFPVMLEAVRECLQDDFDTAALAELMRGIHARRVRVVEVSSAKPSPFAQSLLFGYVAQFLYGEDTPLAERRAAALTLDAGLVADLLGDGADVADLLDPEALASVEAEVELRTEAYRADGAERLVDLVRRLGPVSGEELAARATEPEAVTGWLDELQTARRVIEVRVGGQARWAVVEDAARLRDGLGVALPPGLPEELLEPVPSALVDLVRRYSRTHGPFRAQELAGHYGLGIGAVAPVLDDLTSRAVLAAGTLRPAQAHTPASAQLPGPDYCDADVLRRIRRRSLAALRAEVEAVPGEQLAVYLPRWHQVRALRGVDGVLAVIDQLAGAGVAASAWESMVLPARVRDYTPEMLDELTSSGEVIWVGAGGGPGNDGLVALLPAEAVADLAPEPEEVTGPVPAAVLEVLAGGGGVFFRDLAAGVVEQLGEQAPSESELLDALWETVWAGLVTNDTLTPLRARLGARPRPGTNARRRARPRGRSLRALALRGASLDQGAPMISAASAGGAGAGGLRAGGARAARSIPDEALGRWSLVRARSEPGRRATMAALALIDRDGLVTRGSAADRLPGGFSTAYRVLGQLEESGQVRRGYFVEGLGGAQFALPDAVDALRAAEPDGAGSLLLAATDPANPYGAALGWPDPVSVAGEATGHRPGRKVGASVVLVGGQLVLYLERGARSVLAFTAEPEPLAAAAAELVAVAGSGALGRFTVTRIDGQRALGSTSATAAALTEAGFIAAPSGLRIPRR
ncbi:DEAD/DEAH box helicase [Ruania zhangjianzhongii]|uniref:DEAD/DEAH box helicase n=1 Tax=Ruania zhangjianzhongii TaxID=2603206 RepID=UPI0011D29970